MRAILAILTAAVLLAACATSTDKSGQPAAGVEERKPGGAKPVESKPIARVEPGGKPSGAGFAALKDPNNILSKRSIFYDYDKFDVKDEYRNLVEAHAKFLRENPAVAAKLEAELREKFQPEEAKRDEGADDDGDE